MELNALGKEGLTNISNSRAWKMRVEKGNGEGKTAKLACPP